MDPPLWLNAIRASAEACGGSFPHQTGHHFFVPPVVQWKAKAASSPGLARMALRSAPGGSPVLNGEVGPGALVERWRVLGGRCVGGNRSPGIGLDPSDLAGPGRETVLVIGACGNPASPLSAAKMGSLLASARSQT